MRYDSSKLFQICLSGRSITQWRHRVCISYLKKQVWVFLTTSGCLVLLMPDDFICRLLAGRKQKWTALWQDIQSRKNPLKRCASTWRAQPKMSVCRLRRHRDKVHGGRTANRRAVLDRRNRCLESGSISQAESQIPMIFDIHTALCISTGVGRLGKKWHVYWRRYDTGIAGKTCKKGGIGTCKTIKTCYNI